MAGLGDHRTGGNEILVRHHEGANWSAAEALTAKPSDVFRVQLGAGRKAGLWAIWSEQVSGTGDRYGRQRREDTRVPRTPDRRAATRHSSRGRIDILAGNLWLVSEGFRNGQSDVFVRRHDGNGWTAAEQLSSSPANDWSPAVACDRQGKVYVAWDTYDKGNYDVVMRTLDNGRWGEQTGIATSLKFEAKVTLACDNANRLWAGVERKRAAKLGQRHRVFCFVARRSTFTRSGSLRPLYCRRASGWSRQRDSKHLFLLS